MRIYSIIITLFIVSLFSIGISYMNEEVKQINDNLNITYDNNLKIYDFSLDTKTRMKEIEENLRNLNDPDKGFFSKIMIGLSAVPRVLILIPTIILDIIKGVIEIFEDAGTQIGIHPLITKIASYFFISIVLLKLVEIIAKVEL